VLIRGHLLFTCSDTFAVGLFSHNAQRHRLTDRRTDGSQLRAVRSVFCFSET